MIAQNIENLRNRMQKACSRSGRNVEEVLLVAVTKTFGVDMIREALVVGQVDFGENYVQELNEKRVQLADRPVRWHFIGHLQTNKVKYIAGYVHLIHSVDNLKLAEEIQKRGEKENRRIEVLIEVHTTDEATKHGAAPGEVVGMVKKMSRLDHVRINGLMTMGPFSDDPNDSRPSFQKVVDLKRRIEQEGVENVSMSQLSMGMTHDFEVAIEEGATIIRIGTAIFGERRREEE